MLKIFRNTDKQIQKEKAKLISDLENNSIDFLLEQMQSEEIYSSLLNEKRKTETSNTDYISWYAYRRAEQLNSPTDKEELIQKLNSEPNPQLKRHIYFCLAHLCKNLNDVQLFNFLMEQLENEKSKDCKLSILIGVEEMAKDSSFNIEPLKKLSKGRASQLKINSILALKKTNDPEVEDLLLEQLF